MIWISMNEIVVPQAALVDDGSHNADPCRRDDRIQLGHELLERLPPVQEFERRFLLPDFTLVQDNGIMAAPAEFEPLNVGHCLAGIVLLPEETEAEDEDWIGLIDVFETVIPALVGINDIVAEFGHTELTMKLALKL
jgi:hypothetical protein